MLEGGVENYEVRMHGLLGNKQVKNMREEDFCCRMLGHWMEHTPPAHHTHVSRVPELCMRCATHTTHTRKTLFIVRREGGLVPAAQKKNKVTNSICNAEIFLRHVLAKVHG